MSARPDFSKSRLTEDEMTLIRQLYSETYPVRPLLNRIDQLEAATVILGEIAALVPLSETLRACKTGRTLVDWLKANLKASQSDAGGVSPTGTDKATE